MEVLIASQVLASVIWAVLSLFAMLLTFIAGEQFAVKVPGGVSWTVDAPGISWS